MSETVLPSEWLAAVRAAHAVAEQIVTLLPVAPHVSIYQCTGHVEMSLQRTEITDAVPALHAIADRLGTTVQRTEYSSLEHGASVHWYLTTSLDGVRITIRSPHYQPIAAGEGHAWAIDPHGQRHALRRAELPMAGWRWVTSLDEPEVARS